MSERMLSNAEKRQMKAVIKALKYGIEFCEDDEKGLIWRFIATQSLRINPNTKPDVSKDDFFEAAIKKFYDGKR